MLRGKRYLKRVQELEEDLVLGLFAREHIRVFLSVVALFDIRDFQNSAAVLVNNLEGFLHKATSARVHLAHHASQELVVVDLTVTVGIEQLEDRLVLFLVR